MMNSLDWRITLTNLYNTSDRHKYIQIQQGGINIPWKKQVTSANLTAPTLMTRDKSLLS